MKTSNPKVLETMLNHIENHIPDGERINTKVSKVDVSWHLDHSLKVINNVINAMQNSDPETYENNFSFLGKLFFTLGFFPRGKAKAPKHVRPPEVILKEDLIAQTELAKTNLESLTGLDKNAYFKHPLFGHVNTARVNRFLVLHTNHHLKIVKGILK